jgi:hypothetical protein
MMNILIPYENWMMPYDSLKVCRRKFLTAKSVAEFRGLTAVNGEMLIFGCEPFLVGLV